MVCKSSSIFFMRVFMNTVAIYLHDGFADWEIAYVLPFLRISHYNIITFSEAENKIHSMGGLTLLPDTTIELIDWNTVNLLVLPGGESWSDLSCHHCISHLFPKLEKKGITIAAICAATFGLARSGILNNIYHTSNSLEQLKYYAPDYTGENHYINSLAISDKNIITASGVGSLEFSYEIFKKLGIYDEKKSKEWLGFFKDNIMPSDWVP